MNPLTACPAAEQDLPADLLSTVESRPGDAPTKALGGPIVIDPQTFASATCGRDGTLDLVDERFEAWKLAGPGDALTPRPSGAARICLAADADGRVFPVAAAPADQARGWPLSASVRRRIETGAVSHAVVACAPAGRLGAGSSAFTQRLGLTGLEARVTSGLVRTGDLRLAAKTAGVAYETARKSLKSAMRKAGVRRQGEFVALCVAVHAGQTMPQGDVDHWLIELFGLTPRQARTAILLAEGLERVDVGRRLRISQHLVKAELKTVFGSCGVASAAALAGLVGELRLLNAMVCATEIGFARDVGEPLKLIARQGRRGRIAIADHGPPGAAPVLILHTATTGRHNPQTFVRALQAKGLRPIALDRPGFGLTDMVEGDYLVQSAQDLVDVMDALNLPTASVLARNAGLVVSRLLARHASRVRGAVILNPEPPASADRRRGGLAGQVKGLVYATPWLIEGLARYLSRNASAAIVERLALKSLQASAVDRATLADPEVRAAYVRSSQLSAMQGGAGFIAVARTEPAEAVDMLEDGGAITIVCGLQDPLYSPADSLPPLQDAWPGCRVVTLADAGRLVHLQRPDLIAEILAEPWVG